MSARTIVTLVAVAAAAMWIGWLWGRASNDVAPATANDADHAAPDETTAAPPTLEPERPLLESGSPDDLRARVAELERDLNESRSENERLRQATPEAGAPKPKEASKILLSGADMLRKLRRSSREDLAQIRHLSLYGAAPTEADLELIASLPNLKNLSLRGSRITDESLAFLSTLPLDHLDLRATHITGKGLAHLRSDLLSLHLTDTKVAPRDFDRLPHMDRLETLKLNGIAVDDTAVEWIGRISTLRHLEIDRTLITHEGLTRLIELNPDIRRIEARRAAVDPKKAGDLVGRHPNLDLVLQTYPVVHLPGR